MRGLAIPGWEPSALLDIAQALGTHVRANHNPLSLRRLDLASGVAGVALFFAHLSRFRDPGGEFSTLSLQCLDKIARDLPDAKVIAPGMFDGVAGIAWATEHISRVLAVEDHPSADSYDDVYDFIFEYLLSRGEFEYDLISGLVGIGMWGLTLSDEPWREKITRRVLELLQSAAVHVDTGITWGTPPSRFRRHGTVNASGLPEFNLGLAHGVPGVIGFLSSCVDQDLYPAVSGELLSGALSWLSCQTLTTQSDPTFPFVAGAARPARLAWCYGDAGIALILHQAAGVIRTENIEELAARVCRRVAERRMPEAHVIDASVCHGSAGLAHICGLLASTSTQMARARDYWIETLLNSAQSHGGEIGFPYWNAFARRYEKNIGLLMGLSGVGLTLLSLTKTDLGWDYPFLLQWGGRGRGGHV